MRKFALVAPTALATPAFAAGLTVDSQLGTTVQDIKAALTDMGDEVRKAEMEDGMIEVYFIGDGQRGEVHVSPETGKIMRLKMK